MNSLELILILLATSVALSIAADRIRDLLAVRTEQPRPTAPQVRVLT